MDVAEILGVTITAPTATGTAVTVSEATYVMLFNSAASTNYAVAIQNEADGTTLANVTLAGGERLIIRKDPTHVIYAANAAIMLTPVNPRVK